MKVLLLSRFSPLGASSRVRSYQYLPFLKEHGIEVTAHPLLGDGYLKDFYSGRRTRWGAVLASYFRRLFYLARSFCFDLLWIEKELFPWLPDCGERILAGLGIPYMVDYDDAVFHSYDQHPNAAVRSVLGGKIDSVMRGASLVIAGNDYLAARARQAGARRVEMLPSVIDLARYSVHPPAKAGAFTIGWIGSPSATRFLSSIQPALAGLSRGGDIRLVLVGSGPIKIEGAPLVLRPWSEETEAAEIQGFDVGIMPLEEDAWCKGKCGYKLIQYMACGRPVVASAIGANRQIVDDGVNGFLARAQSDWLRALGALRGDRRLCERMGQAGRSKVEAQYCLKVTAPRLAALARACVG